jgi:hypothetical protein
MDRTTVVEEMMVEETRFRAVMRVWVNVTVLTSQVETLGEAADLLIRTTDTISML